MPLLGFKKRYAADVEALTKRQTVRRRRLDGRDPKPGQTLYLYTGLRSKDCRKIGEHVCTRVEPVKVEWNELVIGAFSQDWEKREAFAKADGFSCWREFAAFIGATHGLPFEGIVVHW